MGFAISWFAVQGQEPRKVQETLGLAPTGRTEGIPESPTVCAELPDGWFLVFANRFDSPLLSERTLSTVSAGCRVIACQVEEHVMYSNAACYENGRKVWRVEHDAQQSIYHLAADGELPEGFHALYDILRREQDAEGGEKADVDFIHDVPVTLAQNITRFRHDETVPGVPDVPYAVLEPIGQANGHAAGKAWWKLW
jgi:hypothetical protein